VRTILIGQLEQVVEVESQLSSDGVDRVRVDCIGGTCGAHDAVNLG
jgi:hypothetical protein